MHRPTLVLFFLALASQIFRVQTRVQGSQRTSSYEQNDNFDSLNAMVRLLLALSPAGACELCNPSTPAPAKCIGFCKGLSTIAQRAIVTRRVHRIVDFAAHALCSMASADVPVWTILRGGATIEHMTQVSEARDDDLNIQGSKEQDCGVLLLPAFLHASNASSSDAAILHQSCQSFAVVTALDNHSTWLLNRLFGTRFPIDTNKLHADLCAPLVHTAPALLFLASADPTPLAALAVADTWVATVPSTSASEILPSLLDRVLDALSMLPPPNASMSPYSLLIIAAEDGGDAGNTSSKRPEALDPVMVQQELEALWARRRADGRVKDDRSPSLQLSVSTAYLPSTTAESLDDNSKHGAALLARFSQPGRDDYLFSAMRRVGDGIELQDVPSLIRELLPLLDSAPAGSCSNTSSAEVAGTTPDRAACACSDEWTALVGCKRAAHLACDLATSEAGVLCALLHKSAFNPVDEFVPMAERILEEGLRLFENSAQPWMTSLAYNSKREAVQRSLVAQLMNLTKLQLEILWNDTLSSFRSELAMLMSESANYNKASARLIKRTSARFGRRVRENIPSSLSGHSHLLREAVSSLHNEMVAEAGSHEREASTLPPREQDVAPASWYKQVCAQAINILLNIAQAYLLQHLPAKRRNAADEREMPRGPLF